MHNTSFAQFCFVIGLSLLLTSQGCQKRSATSETTSAPAELPTIRVELMPVAMETWPTVVRVQGSLVADEQAVLGAKVAGRVAEVHCDLGDFVNANDPLVTIDQVEFQLKVSQAAAELAQVRAAIGLIDGLPIESTSPENLPPVREHRATWEEAKTRIARIRQLYEKNAATDADLEQTIAFERVAAARYEAALNSVREQIALIRVRGVELALAQQQLDETQIHSAFDGRIQARHVAPGSFVQVGQPLVTLVQTNPLRFRGTLPERYTPHLTTGQKIHLRIQSVSAPVEVTVDRISPSLDLRSRSLTFEAQVANEEGMLRDGLFCEGEVVLNPDSVAIAVPLSAVVEFAGTEKVWKVVNGEAQEQVVLTGDRRDGVVVIREGLVEGDQILVQGLQGKIARVEAVSADDRSDLDDEQKPDLHAGKPTGDQPSTSKEVTGSAAGGT